MYRLFAEHSLRHVTSLNGLWEMTAQGKTWPMMIPGVWERIPELRAYKGTAEFRRSVVIDEPGTYLLRFGGVSHTATVYFDGVQVGWHYNAYTAFEVLLKDVSAGEHELRVTVDNRYETGSVLHFPNDYYTYGGLNRPVEMHRLGGAYITRMAFSCRQQGEGTYDATVVVHLRALSDSGALRVALSVAGGEACADVPAMAAGEETVVPVCVSVSGVTPWDIGQGSLYDLTALLLQDGQPIDDLTDRVGFRTIAIAGPDILLNGRKIFLKGFNRHEDHGQFGSALSLDAMMDDLHLILSTGANTVRTCHYPNDPRFLDLCDALGVLVWEENHARGINEETMRDPRFDEVCAKVNEEMVTQHVNHPCIWVWGLLNECESATEFGRSVYKRQIEQLRALDPTRPVTFASCRCLTDVCQDLPDVCSFNIYPLWYHGEPAADYAKRIAEFMDSAGAAEKPIIFSEFGAGAIPGFHDPFRRAKWSEERQCDILREQLEAILGMERVSGAYIWQFADVRVAEEWAHGRPRTMNNKGVFDEFRRPKMSYETVQACFRTR
ncbi:MAG: beta-glucuronidase [Clostridia bacterium]|nr:beta-glucuronidase [Clostridia bacterium]